MDTEPLRGSLGLLVPLFLVVVLRSWMGLGQSFPWKAEWGLPLVLALAAGKAAGGFLMDAMGPWRAAGWSLGLGAVFSTSTKTDVSVLTHEALRAICGATPLPAVAIGGISLANVQELAGSGVEGIAVVSAIFGAPEIREAAQALLAASEKMVG